MSQRIFDFEPITLDQIRDYAEASGDHNQIHLNEDFAKAAGLPGIIAHGMLSMGLGSRALSMWGYDLSKLKNYEAKFKEIVRPGDLLRAEEVRQSHGQIDLRILNQNGIEILVASAKFT